MQFRKKIGLALGGGAVLGAAHIGVLKALEENHIRIGCISGTSIGAFMAALYAFNLSLDKIEAIAQEMDWLDSSGFSFSKLGLLTNEKLGGTIIKAIGDVTFKDAAIDLAIIATDISSSEKVILKHGKVAMAVMASACVPGIFIPVEIDDRLLVDGGLVENVPISPLQAMGAEMIIGVDLNARRKYQRPDDLIDVLANALDIVIDNATRIQMSRADVLITPELNAYSRTDTEKVSEIIKAGYDAAHAVLRQIK